METWTTTTYKLGPKDYPLPVRHKDSVSLYIAGHMGDGRGFSLQLTPDHLPPLREAVAILEDILEQAALAALEPTEPDESIPSTLITEVF